MTKKKDTEGCGCWLRAFFAPVSRPPCQLEKTWLPWRKCNLPAFKPGISATCPFKPILKFGLLWVQFLRRLFIPSSGFVVYAKGNEDNAKPPPGAKTQPGAKTPPGGKQSGGKQSGDKQPAGGKQPECETLVRATELPLYSDYKTKEKPKDDVNDNSVLVTTIRCMRQELCVFMEQVEVVKQQLSDIYLTGKAHTQSTLDYLREEDNTYPRIGAITAGALTGYLLALRKGRFKKLMYMGLGSGAVAAVIYPKEADEMFEEGHAYFKRYVIIAYHFLNGVSRDLTGWELPALPNGGQLSIAEGHHKESGDVVPEPSHLLPPTVAATHLHLHPDSEPKK